MILRRITEHVKAQNWFAVGLDFLIVVVGVFMGIQVNNWNEARKGRVAAQEYLERLSVDIELSIVRNEEQIAHMLNDIVQYDVILSSLDRCEVEPAERGAFAGGIYSLGKYNMPVLISGTIDELNATGNFPLIEDLDLRRAITEAVSQHRRAWDVDGQITARIAPKLDYVFDRVRINIDKYAGASRDLDEGAVDYDLEMICLDEIFKNAIALIRDQTLTVIYFNETRLSGQRELKSKLDAGLGRAQIEKEAG
jgi:hypothetical protein